MNLLFKRAIGVEMDDIEIRVVELQERNKKVFLSGYDRIPLSPGIVTDGKISKSQELEPCLRKIWTKNKFTKKNIILGLSNQDVMIRKISLPDIPKEKLDLLVANHAQEYIPFSLDDSVVDYMVVGKRETKDIKNVEILLAAAQLPMVESFYQCFRRSGFKIKDIKISSLAVLDVIREEKMKGITLLIDMANNLGNLIICIDGKPRLVRLLRVNLNQSTGLNPAAITSEMELMEIVLSTWTQILYNEIRSSIQYFETYEKVNNIDRILLSGSGSRIRGIDSALENSLDIPVELIDPIEQFTISRERLSHGQIIDYTTCIGLALAGLE